MDGVEVVRSRRRKGTWGDGVFPPYPRVGSQGQILILVRRECFAVAKTWLRCLVGKRYESQSRKAKRYQVDWVGDVGSCVLRRPLEPTCLTRARISKSELFPANKVLFSRRLGPNTSIPDKISSIGVRDHRRREAVRSRIQRGTVYLVHPDGGWWDNGFRIFQTSLTCRWQLPAGRLRGLRHEV